MNAVKENWWKIQVDGEWYRGSDLPTLRNVLLDKRNQFQKAADQVERDILEVEGVCTQCKRKLHWYRGPLCRYCDGTAE